MNTKGVVAAVILGSSLAVVILGGRAVTAQDAGPAKYSVKVPGGLAFSEFKGYESWQTIAISHSEKLLAVTLGNPEMIKAFQGGIPENGKPFPDGAQMAKVHWNPKKHPTFATTAVPDTLHDVDFMMKDSKRFADGGGWGYAAFKYDTATDTFTPATQSDTPPQGHDAKCGVACHTIVKNRDYVFTVYGKR